MLSAGGGIWRTEHAADRTPRGAVAQLPPPGRTQNPYAELLYAALAERGLSRVAFPDFNLSTLWRSRRTIRYLHFHWRPDFWYAPCLPTNGRAGALGQARATAQLGRFAFRLICARLLRYRIVWTVHEIRPHRHVKIDRLGLALLARASNVLLAHDQAVADRLRRELGRPLSIEVVPHGTFKDVYPVARSSTQARAELGIPEGAFVFLCFGHLRADKQVDLLLDAFAAVEQPEVYLVVAGEPAHDPTRRRLEAAAARDDRIRVVLEQVPVARVGELFALADAFVLARSEIWTSGSLVLSLSLGLPAVAARLAPVVEVLGDGKAGWLFRPGDLESLAETLRSAAADREAAAEKRAAAQTRGLLLPTWEEVAERTAYLFTAPRQSSPNARPRPRECAETRAQA